LIARICVYIWIIQHLYIQLYRVVQ
jgi:hypothetical protein